LILVGDSAGQANPLVLEGIRYAIKFGRVAGKVSSDAIKSGKTDESALYPYEKNWRKDIESKINSAGKVQDRWIGLSDEEWDKELDIIKELKSGIYVVQYRQGGIKRCAFPGTGRARNQYHSIRRCK